MKLKSRENSHNFNFEGGYDLRRICASWFVSYSYFKYVDKNHLNWQKISTFEDRISKYSKSRQYHKIWLSKIKDMSSASLNRNHLDLNAEQIKSMAIEIQNKIGEAGL